MGRIISYALNAEPAMWHAVLVLNQHEKYYTKERTQKFSSFDFASSVERYWLNFQSGIPLKQVEFCAFSSEKRDYKAYFYANGQILLFIEQSFLLFVECYADFCERINDYM